MLISTAVRNEVPDVTKEGLLPYDYIILTTKNIPDVPPTVAQLIAPALPKNKTAAQSTIVLIQNGLNIEKPLLEAYPYTPVLSGVSLIGSEEREPGMIIQDDKGTYL
jgi:ketopantoate reductase